MTWKIESFTDVDGNKDREFIALHRPARRARRSRFELAVNGPQRLLREHGWRTVDAMGVSRSLWDYRDFIQRLEGRVRRRQARLRVAPLGLVQRSHRVLPGGRPAGARAGHRLERAPARRAPGCLGSRRRKRRSTASTASSATTPCTRGGRDEIAREHFDAARVLPPFLEIACGELRCASRWWRPWRTPVPPPRSGSIETMTALLTEGLVARGHDVTLFATGDSTTRAPRCTPRFQRGYREDRRSGRGSCASCSTWPRRSSAAAAFDVIHCQAEYCAAVAGLRAVCRRRRCCRRVHHAPRARRGRALVALPRGAVRGRVARRRRALLAGLNVVGTIHHAVDTDGVPVPGRRPTTTCSSSAASPRARACCRRSTLARRTGHAAAAGGQGERLLPRASSRRSWTAAQVVYVGEVRPRREGRAARRRAGAALSRAGRRAVRPRAGRGDGVRHAGRGARPRRRVASSSTTASPAGVRRRSTRWSRACRGCWRSTARAVRAAAVDALRRRPDGGRLPDVYRRCRARASPGAAGVTAAGHARRDGPSLLAVFAHPDDESLACGGLLARCAARGAAVSLLCVTRGGLGAARRSGAGGAWARRERASWTRRRASWACSEVIAARLPERLPAVGRPRRLEADIRARHRRLQPDVVVTFGEDGLYWHPDHIVVHERTTAAVAALGAHAPALFYVTMPPGSMRRPGRGGSGRRRIRPPIAARCSASTVDAFGAVRGAADARARRQRVRRPQAGARCAVIARRSPATRLDRLPTDEAAPLLGAEHYTAAPPVGARPTSLHRPAGPSMRTLMHETLLDLLRCPFCGARLDLARERRAGSRRDGRIESGVLGCECCAFPVVAASRCCLPTTATRDGDARARGRTRTRTALFDAARPRRARARRARSARCSARGDSADVSRRDRGLSPDPEGTYFVYRFSDPTFVMAEAVLRALARLPAALPGRVLDLCGGSGHLTRVLTRPPARPRPWSSPTCSSGSCGWPARFTAPARVAGLLRRQPAAAVRARRRFSTVVLSDAFPYIWHKRLLADEMMRLAGAGRHHRACRICTARSARTSRRGHDADAAAYARSVRRARAAAVPATRQLLDQASPAPGWTSRTPSRRRTSERATRSR